MQPRAWPTLPLPRTQEERAALVAKLGGEEKFAEWLVRREELIDLEQSDPLRYGHEMASWKRIRELFKDHDEILALGGNGSGKSWCSVKFGVEALVRNEDWEVAFFHSSNESSINQQQDLVHRFLPPEWRDLGKVNNKTNVSYTRQNGFSNGRFVLPNGSRGLFFNFTQDVRVIVGYKLNMAICDELITQEFLDEIRYRLWDRHGKLLMTFTPVEGYSPVVKDFIEGAEVLETLAARFLPAEERHVTGCPRGTMPYVLRCWRPQSAVVVFFSEHNPYNDPKELEKRFNGETRGRIKIRAYGWPEKMVASAFPKFGKANVVKSAAVPKKLTRYLIADPGGAKNWFLVWIGVDELGRIFVYREWPDAGLGEWALPSEKADGKPGPAQRAEAGRGVRSMKELIWGLEGANKLGLGGEDIEQRLIDPRAGAAAVPSAEKGTSVIELMAESHLNKEGQEEVGSMTWFPAPASTVLEGIDLLQPWFDWDMEKPLDALNCPRCYVAEGCRNVIYALSTWTGADGGDGACKDPVDCLRYAAKAGLGWVDRGAAVVCGGGSY